MPSALQATADVIVKIVYLDEGITEADIRESASARKQRVAKCIRKLLEAGWLLRTGDGVRGDPFRYFISDHVKKEFKPRWQFQIPRYF
jgi:predicted transcriptional regulator